MKIDKREARKSLIHAFAEKLASEILTVSVSGKQVECERAAMMKAETDGRETYLAGRNKQSIVGVIEGLLTDEFRDVI